MLGGKHSKFVLVAACNDDRIYLFKVEQSEFMKIPGDARGLDD